MNKSIPDLDQLKQKRDTAFQNKLIHVVYQLFNSFGFNKSFHHYLARKNQSRLKKKCKDHYGLRQINQIVTN